MDPLNAQHMKQFYILCIAALSLLSNAAAQPGIADKINTEQDRGPSVQALEKEAARRQREGDFYGAMQLYGRALEADTLNPRALEGYGQAAYDFYALPQADWAYTTLLSNNMGKADQSTLLRLAEVKYRQGMYQEAKALYYNYLFVNPPPEAKRAELALAQEYLERSDWAIALQKESKGLISVSPVDTLINTPFAEYSPRWFESKLFFSSYRFSFDKDHQRPKRHLIKVMTAEGMGLPGGPVVQAYPLGDPDKLVAHAAFSSDGQSMYYCECNYTGAAAYRCDIFRKKRIGDTWGAEEKLPESINNTLYNNTQPAVGRLPDGRELLFFVSDRPGKGGKDIWYAPILQDGFGDPVNLSAVNTPEDDVTPFYHEKSKTLYYSTTGLMTLGGFDVYSSAYSGKGWNTPVHTGADLNSSANDVYFSLTPTGRTGFICSNRAGAINFSEEACCYDIFKVDMEKPELIAVNFNKLSGDSLSETTMTLLTMDGDVAVSELTVPVSGPTRRFKIDPGKSYAIISEKNRFISDTVRFTTPTVIWDEEIVQKLYLEPGAVKLIVNVFDRTDDDQPLNGTTGRLETFKSLESDGSWLTGQAGAPLRSEQRVNPGNHRYIYYLDFDGEYAVKASKPGYTSDGVIISTMGLKRSTTIEKNLYLSRGVEFEAFAINDLTERPLTGVTFQLVDITDRQYTIKDIKVKELDNEYSQVLAFDRRYMIIASKEDYSTDSLEFSTVDLPKVDFQKITRELRLRSLKLRDYLPIVLFFDNDQPNPRSRATTTDVLYSETFFQYIKRKAEYISVFTAGMSPERNAQSQKEIETFFEDSLRTNGWENFRQFTEILYDILENGDSVEITLKGFASPLASAEYNHNLTERRVASVFNFFKFYEGGIYNKYLQSRRLTILREPNGSTKAPPSVSADAKDRRNSVFGIPAARERRVEIVGIAVKTTVPN